ncbi:MAG: NUDIX domain-containing protein [Acidimicrobiia bacterium]|nr:NUDIX domain-containing protein [Acidimicrobiia bacterium]
MPIAPSHLRDLLTTFVPPDELQASYRSRMLDLTRIDGDPTAGDLYDPGHFTASGFVAAPDRDGVLLIHHTKIGTWLQPGGHIEPDDVSIERAIRREVEEETGLADMASLGLLDIDIHQFPARRDGPAHLHFDVRFGFLAASGIVTSGEGTRDVRWVEFDHVSLWNSDVSVTRPCMALQSLVRQSSAG